MRSISFRLAASGRSRSHTRFAPIPPHLRLYLREIVLFFVAVEVQEAAGGAEGGLLAGQDFLLVVF